MITEKTNKDVLYTAIDEEVSSLATLLSALDEKKINTIPYKDSWTAAQLVRHVTISTEAMAKAMTSDSKPAGRDPEQRIPELKKIFLDYSRKLNAPDFIVPEEGPFKKQAIIDDLKRAFSQLKENAATANLTELVEGLPLGPITKSEILHFVLYHMQRHLHQMKKIVTALDGNDNSLSGQ